MTRLLQVSALLAILLFVTNESDARGGGHSAGRAAGHGTAKTGNGGHNTHSHQSNHKQVPNAHKRGRDFRFDSHYWNAAYGCYFLWSGADGCYFYYYPPEDCYYPAAYAQYYPPTPGVPPTSQMQPGMLPPSAAPPMPPLQ